MIKIHRWYLFVVIPALVGMTGCAADVSESTSVHLKANQAATLSVTGNPVQTDIRNLGPGDVGVTVKRGDGSVSQQQVITGLNNLLIETTDVSSIVLTTITGQKADLDIRALKHTRVKLTGPTDLPQAGSTGGP
jgi:hypothetical protein